jgi:hypothetical protein
MLQCLHLLSQFLDLPGECFVAVACQHVAENGSAGAQTDLIVLAVLDEAF